MKNIFLLSLLIAASNAIQAQEQLKIGAVQSSWNLYDASIDSSTIVVTPSGTYAQCEVYLYFSNKCTPLTNPADSLEVAMHFNLPYDAEVTDLWLWLYDLPMQAYIFDRWTATTIYEGIVNRRRDPALLLKNAPGDYELRVFPLLTYMPRKVKMTLLLPISSVTSSSGILSLPWNILKLSKCPIEKINLIVKEDLNFEPPAIAENLNIPFVQNNSAEYGNYFESNLTNAGLSSLTLQLNRTTPSNSFMAVYYSAPNEGYYQFEINPSEIFNLEDYKKSLFIIDFNESQSSVTKSELVNMLKSNLKQYFKAGDSLNIIITGMPSYFLSSNWISADSVSLESALNLLQPAQIASNTYLNVAMLEGINFIQSHGNNGNIVLISSTTTYSSIYNIGYTNQFYNLVVSAMGSQKIPIHILHLDTKSYPVKYNDGKYYIGNGYLYKLLTKYTGGLYHSVKDAVTSSIEPYVIQTQHISSAIKNTLNYLGNYFTALSINISMQNGIFYSDYKLKSPGALYYYNSSYTETGKFYGAFPAYMDIVALSSTSELYNAQIIINETDLMITDINTQKLWTGRYINDLMQNNQNSNLIYQIITASINNRVLSEYTAFLALEPGVIIDTALFDTPNTNVPVSINKTDKTTGINLYPNPANDFITIDITTHQVEPVTIEIFNVMGSLIHSYTILCNDNQCTKTLNVQDLNAGIYFIKIREANRDIYYDKLVIAR